MPIKFKCPHCGKQLSVKEQLAGKKANCPNPECKKELTIPGATPTAVAPPAPVPSPGSQPSAGVTAAGSPGSASGAVKDGVAAKPPVPAVEAPPHEPGDTEALAASLLADEPAPASNQPPQTLKFVCSYCDEEVEVDVAMAGKQSPCPACRRIVKVPHLQEQKKVDWRNANSGLPSAARRDTEPAPEGAWGTAATARVSTEALEEADALPDVRTPVTVRQWIRRGVLAAVAIGVLVFGTLFVIDKLGRGKVRAMYDKAMALVSGAKPDVSGYPAAIVHLSAGTYHIRRNEKDCVKADKGENNAWQQFGRARALLGSGDGRVPECDAMLVELALAQIDLAGNDNAVLERTRLPWKDTRQEIAQTLRQVRDPVIRAQGMRLVVRKLIDRGQAGVAADVANQFSDGPEVLAVAAIELQLAGEAERAAALIGPVLAMLDAPPAPKKRPLIPSVEAQALLIKASREKADRLAKRMQRDDVEEAEVTALVFAGNLDEARKRALAIPLPAAQLRSLAILADLPGSQASAKAAVEDAVTLVQTPAMANQALPALPTYRLIDAGLRNGVDANRLRILADRVQPEERLRAWAQLHLFRHALQDSAGTVEESQLAAIEQGTLSHSLGRVALARHNAWKDSDTTKQIDDWDEALRAFGYIGAALGLQGE